MRKPKWKITFKNLPKIPKAKLWNNTGNTPEQIISKKLLFKEKISKEEIKTMQILTKFYKDLEKKLNCLDYSSFKGNDFENFKNYISYAFNYMALVSTQLTLFVTFRLVVNEWITKENNRITKVDLLKYPPLNIVKAVNRYNRANTPSTNVFYSAETIDTTLKETRPPLNKLVTVGVWKPNQNGTPLTSYPISHSANAYKVNEGVKKSTDSFNSQFKGTSKIFKNYIENFFKLLGREYTKPVEHHHEYLITSLFSEKIFGIKDKYPIFNFDCIIYPSVGTNYVTDNIAMKPSVLDNKFHLDRAIEFEIVESYYDNPINRNQPQKITLAKIKNLTVSKKILENGTIEW